MGTYLSARELAEVEAAENAFRSPVPTQMISNGEFNPLPQTAQQKQVEARIKELADIHGARQGLDRRQFLRTSCGMAAAFVAMNHVFGNLFEVSEAEAAEPAQAAERAEMLKGQFIFDVQTHFVRDDYQQEGILGIPQYGAEHLNTGLDKTKLNLYLLKFENYVRQIFLNSDTTVALLSGAPFDDKSWEFLSNPAIGDAVKMVNKTAGRRRWTDPWSSTVPPVGRCIRLATRYRQRPNTPGGLTTRSWCIPSTKRPCKQASGPSACTKG